MEKKQKKQSGLVDGEMKFRLLVQGVTDYAIYMLDPEGRVSNWNLGGQRIKGYLPDEIVGEHFSRFYTPADREAGKPARALQIAREKGRYEEEGLRVRKDGSFFWASVIIDPIRDDTGELIGFAKITRDITERREAQQKLERVQKQLAESQKMDALGQLTGGVAHDFNNLLMAVTGGTRMIKRFASDPRILEAAQAIEATVQRGAALTRQLLTFARRQQINPVKIDVVEAIASIEEVLRAGVGRSIDLIVNAVEDVWPVVADASELETALMNLVFNARDAMPQGGRITIDVKNVHDGERSGDHVCIAVIDTGQGIPDDVLTKVFDPFFTTKPVGKGTGLGLSQVHGFANQAGGSVQISTQLGKGTEVSLLLPRHRVAEMNNASLSREVRTVLVVEDNPDVATAHAGLLEELGYRVKWVRDAPSALQSLDRDDIDLVFSDVVMPGEMDGLGLARYLRDHQPDMPVILATGYSEAARKSGLEFPILRKPYELHELSRALEAAIDLRTRDASTVSAARSPRAGTSCSG